MTRSPPPGPADVAAVATPLLPAPPDLPLHPPPSLFLFILSPGAGRWLADDLAQLRAALRWQNQAIYAIATELPALAAAFGPLIQSQEDLLMSMDEIKAEQTRAETATTAVLEAIQSEVSDLKNAVANLGSAPTAAELSAFKDRVSANADRMESGLATLRSDDAPAAPAPPTPPEA